MIRRWSHVIELANDFALPFYYKKRFKFRIFRLNVRFRRFNLKKTKFKRKSLMRFRHRANWYLYFNIIKTWSQDFKFNKNYAKYQYLNNILVNNAVVFDPNYFKFKSEFYLYNFDGKISNVSKKFYCYLHKKPLDTIKNTNFTFAWFLNDFDTTSNITPLYQYYDFKFYNPLIIAKPSALFFYKNLSFSLTLIKILEIKKVINYLFFYHMFKR